MVNEKFDAFRMHFLKNTEHLYSEQVSKFIIDIDIYL